MPLDKGMSHEDMVAELMRGYKKTGKIGATTPRDKKHALEIANAVAYNLEESKEIKKIEKEVTEMELSELLEALEEIVSAKEEELGIFEIEENPKVKVTLDSGETFETEVDPATSEDDLEKQYKIGTEINVGKEGQERKARIKSATLTKQVGESFDQQSYDMYVKDPDLYDLEMLQDLKQGFMDKRGSWTDEDIAELNAITKRMRELEFDESLEDNKYYDIFKNMDLDKEALQHSLKVLKANKKGSISQEQIDAIEKILNEDLENPPAVIENPTDVISLDIPLLMRLLEWSREQAGEDVDLHVLTENLVEAMKDTEFLTMDDYERLVPCEECNDDEELEECDGSCATTSSDMGADQVLPFGKKNKVKKLKNKKYNRTVK